MEFLFKKSSLVPSKELKKIARRLFPYRNQISEIIKNKNWFANEASLNLPDDQDILTIVEKTVNKKVTKDLKYLINIGIGGSNLGTKAIYDALFGFFDPLEPDRYPKIIFADTNNPNKLAKIKKIISQKIKSATEILINIVSKSGETTETIANFEILIKPLFNRFPSINDRVVVTTGKNSPLWREAKKKGIDCLPIPKKVGGRYSVFSAVGLFPLAAVGINIKKLRQGALKARRESTQKDYLKDPALISAIITYYHYQKNKNINNTFFFAGELESLGKWYRQLMGESLGKTDCYGHKNCLVGITPIVSIGSTDLHSVGQLYLGGPKDKITTFVAVKNNNHDQRIGQRFFNRLVPIIKGKKLSTIMDSILKGTKTAYKKQKLPFMEVFLKENNESALGEYLQFKMIEMMYLAKLLNVNAFNQPHVELYKKETRKILQGTK